MKKKASIEVSHKMVWLIGDTYNVVDLATDKAIYQGSMFDCADFIKSMERREMGTPDMKIKGLVLWCVRMGCTKSVNSKDSRCGLSDRLAKNCEHSRECHRWKTRVSPLGEKRIISKTHSGNFTESIRLHIDFITKLVKKGYNISKNVRNITFQKTSNPDLEKQTYLMKDEATGLYKIGKSNNPKYREKTLRSDKPSVKLVWQTDQDIEGDLHDFFAKERVRGEWFKLSPGQVRFICKLGSNILVRQASPEVPRFA